MSKSSVTQLSIALDPQYSDEEKQAIAEAIVEYMRERTAKGIGVGGGKIASSYSEEYAHSLDFKNAGKSKGKVDMELSGDMMGALDVLDVKRSKIIVGWEKGSAEEPIAEGNILGTYGQASPIAGRAKNFFGLTDKELSLILADFPLEDRKASRDNAELYKMASQAPAFGSTRDEADDG